MRLIDADKIDYKAIMVGEDEFAGYRAVAYESDIDEMPTVDTVEVVRCKDCLQYTPVEGGKPLCALHSIAVAHDDYCSYGERRNDG